MVKKGMPGESRVISYQFHAEKYFLGETSFVLLDIVETPSEFIFEVEVAGVPAESVSVKLDGPNLVIEGVKTDSLPAGEPINFLCMERAFGPFRRIVQIPESINPDKIKVLHKNGLLKITIEKAAQKQNESRTVDIGG